MGLKKENICISNITETKFYPRSLPGNTGPTSCNCGNIQQPQNLLLAWLINSKYTTTYLVILIRATYLERSASMFHLWLSVLWPGAKPLQFTINWRANYKPYCTLYCTILYTQLYNFILQIVQLKKQLTDSLIYEKKRFKIFCFLTVVFHNSLHFIVKGSARN